MIQSFTHPTHGPLTVHERIGRSRRCQKADGTSVTISSKEINKLSVAGGMPALDIVGTVRDHLFNMEDTVERVRVAKEIWHLADGYLQS